MLAYRSCIGILGGGQLGRMLAVSAAHLGFTTVVLDPDEKCPAAQVANSLLVAPLDDFSALGELSRLCSVLTYEFENIPADPLDLVAQKIPVYPSVKALRIAQDRLLEKHFFQGIGLEPAPFCVIDSESRLLEALDAFGKKGILKTRRAGYDGKGQIVLDATICPKKAYATLSPFPCILESVVSFECEISVIAVRSSSGALRAYDPSENFHSSGILQSARVPARIPVCVARRAQEVAFLILEALDYVGVIGIEFFVLPGGRLVINEMAPRVHNSGHWTEAVCVTSQFEQHIRAIGGLPLGGCSYHCPCVMENVFGQDIDNAFQMLSDPNVLLRLYGKGKKVRKNQKMGHSIRVLPSKET